MDKSASQSRLSRSQLPPQEAGSAALRLDQLTDLDQAISLSRGSSAEASSRPTPVAARAVPKPPLTPKSAPAPVLPKPTPKPVIPQQFIQSQPSIQPTPVPAQPKQSKPQKPATEPPVVPVRSAKEAINAMYAGENPARLSDYLGASAKEIINATARGAASDRDTKSASSLHHASSQRKLEATRPSASAIFRAAKSEKSTPVVHTSLELEPQSLKAPSRAVNVTSASSSKPPKSAKPTPIVINSRPRAANPRSATPVSRPVASVRPKKGQIKITTPSPTAIAVSAIEEAAGAITKPQKSAKSTTNTPRTSAPTAPSRARRPGLVDGFARPVKPAATSSSSSSAANISASRRSRTTQPESGPYQKLPADSVKRRFRLAPKGFAANKPEQARPARRKFMSFSNPDYTVPVPKPSPAVEIYGLTEPEPAPERDKDGLGVVEDYRPQNPANPAMNTPAANNVDAHGADHANFDNFSAKNSRENDAKSPKSAPDNNRYALGGQSPFFLKSVSVEKRPLSDAPTRRSDTISPIYTDPGDDVPRKNVYDGKSAAKSPKSTKKGSPRDLPQRPTVIIPSSRRSHTPLFLLLILTVILGAAVGAAVYFFFFQ